MSDLSNEGDEDDIFDVIIIGAGLSGMTAAYRLYQMKPNISMKVLEAKDRIGGRIFTADLPAAKNSIDLWDLGGNWIGNKAIQPYINQLISDLKLSTYPQSFSGNKILQAGNKNKISVYDSSIPDMGLLSLYDASKLMKSLENLQKKMTSSDCLLDPNLLEYDSITAETLIKKKTMTKCTLDCIRSGFRASFGSELNKLSALYLFAFANSCGGFFNMLESGASSAHGFKIVGGASRLPLTILNAVGRHVLDIKTVVTSIYAREQYSLIKTSTGIYYKTRFIVMAIPPHLIPFIKFEPPLNPTKIEYFSSVTPGHLIKVILTYEKRFWFDAGYSGEVVTNGGSSSTTGCSSGPLCVVFDATTENNSPALLCFIGGEQALQYENKSKSERREAVLLSLEQFFEKENVRNFIVYCEKIWRHESYIGGCPVVTAPPGVARYFNQSLRSPENKIHFAGSELANSWIGYMEGAVESGERAAMQILSQLETSSS